MKTTILKRIRPRAGFTLSELVICIAILGLLATVAMPVFANTLDNSKRKTDEAAVSMVQTALDTYYIEKEGYPSAADFKELVKELNTAKYLNKSEYSPKAKGAVMTYDARTHIVGYSASTTN